MKAIVMIQIFIMIIVTSLFLWIFSIFNTKYTETETSYKNLVGKYVVIEQDTMQITNYNMWSGNLFLSNGTKISKDFAEHQLIKNHDTRRN